MTGVGAEADKLAPYPSLIQGNLYVTLLNGTSEVGQNRACGSFAYKSPCNPLPPTPAPDRPFAAKLRKLLDDHHVTRTNLAGHVGVSRNTVTSWTQGIHQPGMGHAKAIASVFGMTVDELLAMQERDSSPRALAAPRADGAEDIIASLAQLDPDPAAAELAALSRDLMNVLRRAQAFVASRR
jgi:transcriptional regulator with XRE-family HTH domain